MLPIVYIVSVVAILGLVAIFWRRNAVLRRWIIYSYGALIAFVGFSIFATMPRMAMNRLEAEGAWSQEAAHGVLVMHDVYMGLGGLLVVVALVLVVLALLPRD